VPWAFLPTIQLPVTIALAAIAALGYMVSRARGARRQFTLFDALAIVLLMAIVTAAAIPLLESTARGARQSALMQNLYTLRSQIQLYRLQHAGEPPVLHEGTLPQLLTRTDMAGVSGPVGNEHPYGPYLPRGIPVNPVTGRSVIASCDSFPPKMASGNGGWLYHQESGQIAADLPDMLGR
jgi:general secretion pathway protein G